MKKIIYRSFSLIEFLCVISILLALVTLLTPALKKMSQSAQFVHCAKNLKQVHQATIFYADDNFGLAPGPCKGQVTPSYRTIKYNDETGYVRRNYMQFQNYIYPYFSTTTNEAGKKYIKDLVCPSNEELDLLGNVISRQNYNLLSPIFGEKSYVRNNEYIPPLPSQLIYTQSNPSGINIIVDAIDNNQLQDSVPDWPVHFGSLRNVLYLDGHVSETDQLFNQDI